jgi:hypothetical protein
VRRTLIIVGIAVVLIAGAAAIIASTGGSEHNASRAPSIAAATSTELTPTGTVHEPSTTEAPADLAAACRGVSDLQAFAVNAPPATQLGPRIDSFKGQFGAAFPATTLSKISILDTSALADLARYCQQHTGVATPSAVPQATYTVTGDGSAQLTLHNAERAAPGFGNGHLPDHPGWERAAISDVERRLCDRNVQHEHPELIGGNRRSQVRSERCLPFRRRASASRS